MTETTAETTTTGPGSDGSTLIDDLDKWVWSEAANDYVREADPLPEEAREAIAESTDKKGLTVEEFEALYSSESFRNNVRFALGLGSKMTGLQSMKVEEDDAAFAKAMEVAYRRILEGPARNLLKFMSNADLVDFFVVTAWVGPYSKAIHQEAKAKKRATIAARNQRAPSPQPTTPAPQETMEGNFPNE